MYCNIIVDYICVIIEAMSSAMPFFNSNSTPGINDR
jgi:hypothetical protein